MINFKEHGCESNENDDQNMGNFCINMQDFQLQGGFFDIYSAGIMIQLNICNNITSNNTCKTVEEIEEFLQAGKYFGVYYNDYYVDIQNYENPIQIFPRVEQITLSPLSQYLGQLAFRKGEMDQDDGVIFSSLTQLDYFTRDELTSNWISRASIDDPAPLLQFWIESTQKLEQVNRTYQSLQDVLAKLSGIANLMIIVGFLFINIYTKIATNIYLVNKLFSSHLKEKIEPEKRRKSMKTEMTSFSPSLLEKVSDKKINDPFFDTDTPIKFTSIQPKKINESEKDFNEIQLEKVPDKKINASLDTHMTCIQPKKIEESEKYLKDIEDNIIDENEKNLNTIENSPCSTQKEEKIGKNLKRELEKDEKFTIYDYISAKIKDLFRVELSFRQKLYLEVENELKKIMNIKYILRQVYDFECLKNILLNPMQNLIFDSIPKPVNLLKKLEENARNRNDKNQISEKKLNAIKIANYFEKEGRMTEIDDRLIQCLK